MRLVEALSPFSSRNAAVVCGSNFSLKLSVIFATGETGTMIDPSRRTVWDPQEIAASSPPSVEPITQPTELDVVPGLITPRLPSSEVRRTSPGPAPALWHEPLSGRPAPLAEHPLRR